jgi:DNA-binding beta-propeller fold protein YncE
MLALLYVALIVAFGDTIARPFFGYVSRPHRLATAFLVGLLVSSWLTYLVALWFSSSEVQPLIAGDAVTMAFIGFVVGIRVLLGRRPRQLSATSAPPMPRSEAWDWAVIVGIAAFATWMMLATLSSADGKVLLGSHEWGDFGATMAIAQSFAVGHNYPTQYPHFAGLPILYHFLYYFQVGNLTFLGLDPATANNLLSIASLTALLAIVMALGQRLFSSLVGRLGAIAFFFQGSLSFVPFLASFASPATALAGIAALDHYLPSGFPYRGEDWGMWSLNVFITQRHLASAIGVALIVLLFVIQRLQADGVEAQAAESVRTPDPGAPTISIQLPAARLARAVGDRLTHPIDHIRAGLRDPSLPGYVACGFLLGLMPLWNSSMFIASAALFAAVFVLFQHRVQMVALAIAAAIPAIPQVLFLRQPGVPGTQSLPALHWGYIVDPPTVVNVAAYLAFMFGPKLLLVAVGLFAANWLQRRVFLAACSLLAVALLVQVGIEVLFNHKFLNAWLIVVNLFAGYGLVRLWRGLAPGGRWRSLRLGWILVGRATAVLLAAAVLTGGLIDIVPITKDGKVAYSGSGDRLYDWLISQTKPSDVFLSDIYIFHPILLAGRRLYFGYPTFPWSAGYDVATRQKTYAQMLEDPNPREVVALLQENHIAYVAIDDGLRKSIFDIVHRINEDAVFRPNFERVFDDPDNQYSRLSIYKVPADPAAGEAMPNPTPEPSPSPVAVSMSTGGRGSGPGQFVDPRGIAVAPGGDILVADPGNNRIERFAADGTFRASFGESGDGPGQLKEPNGVAVNAAGHVFVADTLHGKLQEFDETGGFIREWPAPEPGFYGPRDVAVGPDDTVYVLDQGHSRVVRLPVAGAASSFGSLGAGAGQLNDPTGLVVAGDQVFVADKGNARIAVFGTDGRVVRSIAVAEWSTPGGYPDVAVSADGRFLLASSPATNEVLVFTLDGARTGSLKAAPPDTLAGPGALAVAADGRILVVDFDAARVSLLPAPGP